LHYTRTVAIRLRYGQRLDALVDGWLASFAPPSGLAPIPVVPRNRAVERWARHRAARRWGAVAGWRALGLETWLEEEAAPDGRRLMTRDRLEAALLDQLLTSPPPPVARYLDAAEGDRERERRCLQTARRLAEGVHELQRRGRSLAPDWIDALVRTSDLVSLTEALRAGWFDPGPQPRPDVHILDALPADPAVLAAVHRLAQGRTLYVLAVNPCLEYWEDLPARANRRPSRHAPSLIDPDDEHPLLLAWAQGGRSLVRGLDRLTDCDFEPSFGLPADGTDLGRTQLDVLHRRRPSPQLADGSLTIARHPSARDEARAVVHRILQASAAGVPLSEMVVGLASEAARPPITAAFAERGLPHHQQDQHLDGPLVDRVERLLDLLVHGARGADLAAFLAPSDLGPEAVRWIREAGVVAGLDEDAHLGSYVDRPVHHWEQGMQRMALGTVLDADHPSHPLPLPELEEVGRWLATVRGLAADLAVLRTARWAPAQWGEAFRSLLTTYATVETDAESDDRALGRWLDACASLDGLAPRGAALAVDELRQRMDRVRVGAGGPGVAVGPLAGLSTVPARIAFVVGLDARTFPRRDQTRPWGLPPRRREDEDRWELLLRLGATTDELHLSYAAGPTGEPPSAVLEELRDTGSGWEQPEPPPPSLVLTTPVLPASPAPPGRSLRAHQLVAFLVDPYAAWLDRLFGRASPLPTPLEEPFGTDPLLLQVQLTELLLEHWPTMNPEGLATALRERLERAARPARAPVGLYREGELLRALGALERWTAQLDRAAVPRHPLHELAVPTRRLGTGDDAFTLAADEVLRAGPQRIEARLSRHPSHAWFVCRSAIAHARANLDHPTESVHVQLTGADPEPALRFTPLPEAEAWLASLGASLLDDRHDLRLPFEAAWTFLQRSAGLGRAERTRLWDGLRWRYGTDDADPLEVPPLPEALPIIEARWGVVHRCLSPPAP
jgi:hypothetical protein